jgi:hydroxymethylpyrimidine pyrophosphatase-like HAD family hydrolase
MEKEQFETGMQLLKENGVFRTIEARNATWGDEDLGDFLAQAGEGNSELVRWRKALAEQLNIRPMQEYDGSPIYKIVFMCKEMKQLEPARQALEKDYNFVVQDVAAHQCLNGELINRRFDKGRGVRIVAEAFGIGIEDTIGFGDSMNDLEMIETVGYSVCMDNGSPKLKEISDLVCPAVEEDGLAWAFEKLGLV